MKRIHSMSVTAMAITLTALGNPACVTRLETGTTPVDIPVTTDSVDTGTTVARKGIPVKLAGGTLHVGDPLPDTTLTGTDWQPYHFAADGVVKVVNVVPSIDTRVCEAQTHRLGESTVLDPRVRRIVVSRDLPAAQARFAQESGLSQVTFLSDYRTGAFGRASGLLMEDTELLARAVMVIDGDGNIRHLQVVPDVTRLPDLAQAIDLANQLESAVR